MTCDDIIRMAREVADKDKDDPYHAGEPPFIVLTDEEFERFAALVAAAEREACEKVLEENAKACVKDSLMYKVLMSNAMAIRAREENP